MFQEIDRQLENVSIAQLEAGQALGHLLCRQGDARDGTAQDNRFWETGRFFEVIYCACLLFWEN